MTNELAMKPKNRRALIEELLFLEEQDELLFYGRRGFKRFIYNTWMLPKMNAAPNIQFYIRSMVNDKSSTKWSREYVLYEKLCIEKEPDASFFIFVEQMVHPHVCIPEQQEALVNIINKHISEDGFILNRSGEITGYPVYAENSADLANDYQ